jgi:GT2 family glycosyltransferase
MLPVSIVIPVFNQLPYTEACLAVLQRDEEVLEQAEIVVVDSGSTDETPAFLEQLQLRWPIVKCTRLIANAGFSRACNAGAAIASGSEVLFLNNDTIPEAGWLSALRKTLCLPRAGIVAPKLLYPDVRTTNHAGYVYNRSLQGFYPIYHHYPESFSGVSRRRDFQALLGACVLLRKSDFDAVGGFSELGLEDIDLCLKIGARGLRAIYEPRAVVLHHGSVTVRNSPEGSIPPTSIKEFNDRWHSDHIVADDEKFYREDGFAIDLIAGHVIHLKEVITSAAAQLAEGIREKKAKNLTQAEELIRGAIATYLGFQAAYEDLIGLLLEQGRIDHAINAARDMISHLAEPQAAVVFLAQLYVKTGRHSEVRKLLLDLQEDWTMSPELSESVTQLVS